MRLLNVNTRELVEITGHATPKYAILSHTWGTDEVQFADVGHVGAANKAGWMKLDSSCRRAADDGLEYLWIDT